MTQALLISNVVLWGSVLVLSLVVVALVRQLGALHERIAPAGALLTAGGPKVGEAAPELDLETLDGAPIRIGGARHDGRWSLLFFLSPRCPVCKTVLPTLLRVSRGEWPRPQIILASDGEGSEHEAFVREHRLEPFPYVSSAGLGLAFQVAKLPYAVLIDGRGVIRAKGLVNTREHVESLFEAARLGVASIQEYMAVVPAKTGDAARGGRV
jgi:methylamine dehydrogenase accessory protein MauD